MDSGDRHIQINLFPPLPPVLTGALPPLSVSLSLKHLPGSLWGPQGRGFVYTAPGRVCGNSQCSVPSTGSCPRGKYVRVLTQVVCGRCNWQGRETWRCGHGLRKGEKQRIEKVGGPGIVRPLPRVSGVGKIGRALYPHFGTQNGKGRQQKGNGLRKMKFSVALGCWLGPIGRCVEGCCVTLSVTW